MRILVQQMSQQMGVPFVVENKPGASFVLGTMDVVKAAPDGYTLGYGNIVSLAINRSLLPSLPYDVERDLTLVSNCLHVFNLSVVNNDLPVRTVAGADRLRKAQSRQAHQRLVRQRHDWAPGRRALQDDDRHGDRACALQRQPAGDQRSHRRADPGDVRQRAVDRATREGGTRACARCLGTEARGIFPEVPTIAEAGVPGYETNSWGGIIGPAKLPREIVQRLHAEIRAALAVPAVVERYRALDSEIDGGTPEEFLALVRRETPKWAEVVRRSGAKID